MGDAIAAYAQPLIDDTDGSAVQMNRALMLAQICWNLASVPEEARDKVIGEMQSILKMNGEEFEAFRRTVLVPMIERHQQMFPRMHRTGLTGASGGVPALQARPTTAVRSEKYPGTARNAPCPCKSGKKYKLCCGG